MAVVCRGVEWQEGRAPCVQRERLFPQRGTHLSLSPWVLQKNPRKIDQKVFIPGMPGGAMRVSSC